MVLILDMLPNVKQLAFAKALRDQCAASNDATPLLGNPFFLKAPKKATYTFWRNSGRAIAYNDALIRAAICTFANRPMKTTAEICIVTHWDPRCVASCIIIHDAMKMIMAGDTTNLALRACQNAALYLSTCHMRDYVRELPGIYEASSDLIKLHLKESGATNYVYKSLGCALWAMRHITVAALSGDKLEYWHMIETVVKLGGDTSVNASIVGALCGTYLGYNALHKQVGDKINEMSDVNELAKKIDGAAARIHDQYI